MARERLTLTLNYGLRWEPFFAAKDQNGFNMAFVRENFDKGVRSTVYPNAPVGLRVPGRSGLPDQRREHQQHMNQFAPRGGIIWDPTRRQRADHPRRPPATTTTRRSCGSTATTC